jgi:glycosyltransferase involved in cell wall biosynthesis
MIVKNESKTILRLLESLDGFIDEFCICDTGSTDDTVEIIRTYAKSKNIKGHIMREQFKNFGYNRNVVLNFANLNSRSEYLLLMDADMVMTYPVKGREEAKAALMTTGGDTFNIMQGTESFHYKNMRIIRNVKDGYSYWGTTHEYINTPPDISKHTVDKSVLFIHDIGDGGSKTDKFARDIGLLKEGLDECPDNDRYLFYLANSYKDYGKYDDAISYYKSRIGVGGWAEEVWMCYYNIGHCYKLLNNIESAVYYWLEAYNHSPHRCEALYELIKHYRETGKHKVAYNLYVMADYERSRLTSTDYLFFKKDVYDYKLDYEMTILGYYYNPRKYDIVGMATKILSTEHASVAICDSVLSNYKFYAKKLRDLKTVESSVVSPENIGLLENIGDALIADTERGGDFNKSTPCVFSVNDWEMYVCVRFVNYRINDDGSYNTKAPGIETINVVAVVDISFPEWKIAKEFILECEGDNNDGSGTRSLYIGLEDVRVFLTADKFSRTPVILYNATRAITYGNICIEYGSISLDDKRTRGSRRLKGRSAVEKNWVLFDDARTDSVKCIYGWYPLIIGDIVGDEYVESHRVATSPFFKRMRGSTNGVLVNGEMWFVTHVVSYTSPRNYYHCFVVLDPTTYAVKRHTPLFKFDSDPIEYTLGFKYFSKTNEFLFGYSKMDRSCNFMCLAKSVIDEMFIVA